MSVLQPFECSAAIMLHIYKARNPLGSQWWRAHKKSIKIQICLIPFFCTTSDDEKLCHLRHRIHRIIRRNERECLNHVVELLEGSRELRVKKGFSISSFNELFTKFSFIVNLRHHLEQNMNAPTQTHSSTFASLSCVCSAHARWKLQVSRISFDYNSN